MQQPHGLSEELPIIRDLPSSRRTVLGAMATLPFASSSDATARALLPLPSATSHAGITTVTPEQFGAIGDGVADDAPAIQRALNSLAALGPHGPGGTVVLQPRVAYRCGSGLVLDATYVSLSGTALLDFSGWEGRYLRVSATSVGILGKESDNNYGHRGMISGAIRLKGAGRKTHSIGVDFDSPNIATSAQLLVENMAVSACGTAIRFGSRAYNNLLIRCEFFDCGICVDWPRADDNGERNTLIGCTLQGSDLAVRVTHSDTTLQLQGCSLDFTGRLYEVQGGSVLATSCHHESNIWSDCTMQCSGDGAMIRLDGCYIVNQATDWTVRNLADVNRGGTIHLIGTRPHNLTLKAPDPSLPASFSKGDGEFRMMETHGFDFSPLPPRLQSTRTQLSDPDFRSGAWEDPVWRIRDTAMPIIDRYGSGTDNLRLVKDIVDGEAVLSAVKAYGASAAAAFVLIALPVRYGDVVLSGFRVRRDPRRTGTNGTLDIIPTWVRIDGYDAERIPVVARSQHVGTQTITPPADRFVPVAPMASRTQRTAPPWATHFCMVVDLVKAHQASLLFNGLWADLI